MNDPFSREVNDLRSACEALRGELARVIVGQREALDLVVIALLAGGHVLLEGVPGLGKTLLVRTLAQTLDLRFSRIQFTPDLMPADILGTNLIVQDDVGRRRFEFQPGPIFAQIVLADEINRATPKTQSALLEAMQEYHVTAAGRTYALERPFFVLATQNPIELEGTYPLPEAQLDRFLLKLRVPFPSLEDLQGIIDRTTGPDDPAVRRVADGAAVRRMQALARRFVRHGASPRGMQALILAGKVRALTLGRFNVAIEDLRALALPALRHRIILNFEGEAEGTDADDVLRAAMQEIEAPDLPAGQREAR